MPDALTAPRWTEMTLEERRERRRLRREKQREDNVKRAAKMHAARLKIKANSSSAPSHIKRSVYVGVRDGVTGNGEIHSMPMCLSRNGSRIA
jgi:hypothetical protein